MINTIAPFNKLNLNNNVNTNTNVSAKTQQIRFDDLSVNNDKNIFLKEYLSKRLAKENVQLPENWEINIESPLKITKRDAKLLRDVRVNTYKARVDDMFRLLEQPKSYIFTVLKSSSRTMFFGLRSR